MFKQILEANLKEFGLNLEIVPELKFSPARKWRFDYALPLVKIAIEIEGGVWSGGRHTRGKGYTGDMEKYNAAALLGWSVLRYTPDQIKAGKTYLEILQLISLKNKFLI